MILKGHNGQVEFDGQTVKIMRKGALALLTQGFKGEKSIPVTQIIAVQYKEASILLNGYIQFATAAGEGRGGVFDATADENTVMFASSQKAEFGKLREAVEAAMKEAHSSGNGGSQESPLDALKKLKDLFDAGVITDEEYENKKSRLMEQI